MRILVKGEAERSVAEQFLMSRGVSLENVTFHIASYDWSWMRDNGPVWILVDGELKVQDWAFDGWGKQVRRWNLDDSVPCQVAANEGVGCEQYALINERGNLEFNGLDTLIASEAVLADRNAGWNRKRMEAYLKRVLGITP